MEHEQAARELDGVYSALFTPLNENDQIDFDKVEALLRYQVEGGLSGFFVCGTTGEGLLLSFDERVELVRFVVDRLKNDPVLKNSNAKVIAHVGHPNSETAGKLAARAADAGADWIGSIGPVFYGGTFESMKRHYSTIARATELPFMIYSFESRIIPERDTQLFDIPNVAGIKYTGTDFFSLQQLARRVDHTVAWISGADELFVAGQAMGCQAGIGSTYNFMPDKFARMQKLCRANDFHAAMEIQKDINKVIDYFCSFENWSFRKAFMRYIGLDCGHCRPPYARLTESEYEDFAKGLDEVGVLERDSATQSATKQD